MRVMICGARRTGKDTLAAMICDALPGTLRIGFADALKDELEEVVFHSRSFLGLHAGDRDLRLLLRDRDLMGPGWQWWGEFMRRTDSDYWVETFDRVVRMLQPEHVVVPDCRHWNEARYGMRNGYLLVRVTGPRRGDREDARGDDHPSEQHWPYLPADVEIDNGSSLGNLRLAAEKVVIPLAREKGGTVPFKS